MKKLSKKEKHALRMREYRKNNPQIFKDMRQRRLQRQPWIESYKKAKYRCENSNCKDYHRYGGRGIEFYLTYNDIDYLWNRDKAYNMEYPTIDRIDNDGNYELSNCQFLENIENATKDLEFCKVIQYDKNLNKIQEFESQTEANRITGINQGSISACVKEIRNFAGGFLWKEIK